jgi:hypothetical protein
MKLEEQHRLKSKIDLLFEILAENVDTEVTENINNPTKVSIYYPLQVKAE